MSKKAATAEEILEALEAGAFKGRLEKAISDTALAVVVNGDKRIKGEVVLKLKFERIAESSQVRVIADVGFDAPTNRGRRSESYACETPMHVESGGRLTLFPEASPLFKGADPARTE